MYTKRTALAALLFLVLSSAPDVFACSCAKRSIDEAYGSYPLIVSGTIEEVEDQFTILRKGWMLLQSVFGRDRDYDERYYGYRAIVRVERVWKGETATKVEIFTGRGGGDCGYHFEVGRSYVIYAYKDDKYWGTGICSRTKPLESAAEDLAFLRAKAGVGPERSQLETPNSGATFRQSSGAPIDSLNLRVRCSRRQPLHNFRESYTSSRAVGAAERQTLDRAGEHD